VVAREDSNFGTAAHFSGARPDLDEILLDLRHLELEERLHEEGVCSAQNETRSLGRLLDALENGANRIALMEVLAMVLLAVRNDCLGLAELVQHDDEFAALDLLNFTGEKVTHPAGELVADLRALAFANALDDTLLRRLDRSATELGEINRDFHLVADLEVRILETRFLERDLARRVGDFFDDRLEENDSNRALVLVDIDFSLYRRAVLLGECGIDAVLEKPVQFGAIDLLRVRQLADRSRRIARASRG